VKSLSGALGSGEFVITTEITPPKGTDTAGIKEKARLLKGKVHAANVTDNQRAVMRLSSLAGSILILQEGLEPVFQLTCRDRNRIAIQSDLLGAWALGIRNILALTGDHVRSGDHQEAKPVFDLDAAQLVKVISTLNEGSDMKGNALSGKTNFFLGAAVNPGAEPQEVQLLSFQKKLSAGAKFFQSQVVFEPSRLKIFVEEAKKHNAFVIGGIMLLKSSKMARFVNEKIPGVLVPPAIIEEMDKANDPVRQGVEIAARLVRELKGIAHGVHIMTMEKEELLPEILSKAGV